MILTSGFGGLCWRLTELPFGLATPSGSVVDARTVGFIGELCVLPRYLPFVNARTVVKASRVTAIHLLDSRE
jgi:hypothetical protein